MESAGRPLAPVSSEGEEVAASTPTPTAITTSTAMMKVAMGCVTVPALLTFRLRLDATALPRQKVSVTPFCRRRCLSVPRNEQNQATDDEHHPGHHRHGEADTHSGELAARANEYLRLGTTSSRPIPASTPKPSRPAMWPLSSSSAECRCARAMTTPRSRSRK
jgi:hypothetical protein